MCEHSVQGLLPERQILLPSPAGRTGVNLMTAAIVKFAGREGQVCFRMSSSQQFCMADILMITTATIPRLWLAREQMVQWPI